MPGPFGRIGPRNRRRLAVAGAGLGIVVSIALAGVLRPQRSGHGKRPVFVTDHLVYGMTRAQVSRLIGEPAKKAGACWQYDENVTVHKRHTLNAERVCFYDGGYSYTYSQLDGWWTYPDGSRRKT